VIGDLIFFDKEGYALNFAYNEQEELYEGKLLFDENSTDTFKTLVLNLFEFVESFSYEDDNNLDLEKFQAFNEKGLVYKGKTFTDEDIVNIETVNSSSDFFSKWVEGPDFHSKFPIGTEVYFHDMAISDFIGPGPELTTFTVVSNKKDAFMVITATDNDTYSDPFVSGKVSSLNVIQVDDYDNLSSWNEPGFEANLYTDRKLSVVNSRKNEGVYTVAEDFLFPKTIDKYSVDEATLIGLPFPSTSYLNIKAVQKTDRIFLYNGLLNFSADFNRIEFLAGSPQLLTPGTDFIFDTGILNSNVIFTVSNEALPPWKSAVAYAIDDLVEFEGSYFRATAATTGDIPSTLVNWESYDFNWNDASTYESGYPVKYQSNIYYSLVNGNNNIQPDTDPASWTTDKTYVIVEQVPTDDIGVSGIANLTTSTLEFVQQFVEDERNTLLTFYNNYRNNFINFGVDITFDQATGTLSFQNIHAERSVEIQIDAMDATADNWNRFFSYGLGDIVLYRGRMYESTLAGNLGNYPNTLVNWSLISDVTTSTSINTYLINVDEQITKDREASVGYYYLPDQSSTYYNRTILFDNIDSFGLNLTINGLDYDIPFDTDVNNTISDWLSAHTADLATLGIVVTSPASGEILFETNYPNVPISIVPRMGSLAVYRFKHSDLQITAANMSILEIVINNVSYFTEFDTDIPTTVQNWIDSYVYVLDNLGIEVDNYVATDTISFGKYEEDTVIEYYVNVGQNYIDILDSHVITNYELGNEGTIISSNSIINTNPGTDLQDLGFATAMITAVSGSDYPLNDKNYNILFLDPDKMVLSYQGPFWSDNTSVINLKTRDFIRQPRFGFDADPTAKFVYEWADDTVPEMFMYDFSGNQLPTGEPLSYVGPKPLIDETTNTKLYLKREANKKIDLIEDPTAQQTVFDQIVYDIEKVDSQVDLTFEPEPFQVFLGYNDPTERSIGSTLYLYFVEDREMLISTDDSSPVDIIEIDADNWQINLTSTTLSFFDYGFAPGQIITITGYDNTNTINQSRWENNGLYFQVKEVFDKIIVLDSEKSINIPISESSFRTVKSSQPPFSDVPTGMDVTIKVEPKPLLRCELYGQSEEEDERYKTRLNNYGHNVGHKDVYIFREYDIQEKGIDWVYLNRKRKELLMNEREIFNHVTAYKSLINAIKFFGYNDLELYEYYRNINPEDDNYKKLHKVEIPNIFDNRDSRYEEVDPLFFTLPNKNFEKTKLLNLTYRITDFDGNSVQAFSLDEVITKLSGLKDWLQRKTLAVNTKILDITGRTDVRHSSYAKHSSNFVRNLKSNDEVAAVMFEVEGYKQPVSNGSSLYNINIKFKTQDGSVPDYFNLSIRTYRTYPEWDPTAIYSIGDKVIYKGLIYEARTNNNTAKAPDTNLFTDWKEAKLEIVQTIKELKTDLNDYNFVMDKDVDAFAEIRATVENGYGATITYNKNISLDNVYILSDILFRNTGVTRSFSSGFNNNAFF
jgi:hypothetical protein